MYKPAILLFLICVFITANAQDPAETDKDQEVVRAKGIALLIEMESAIAQIKSPLTRIKAQLQVARLLWTTDEKRAGKYLTDATTGFKEYLVSIDASSENYPQQFQAINELRFQIIRILADHDPDAALNFLYSSKPPPNPFETNRFNLMQEGMLELSIARQISQTDPGKALQIARHSLKTHYSLNLVSTVGLLRLNNPELASQFASEIVSKLLNEKLLSTPEAATVAVNLLRYGHGPLNNGSAPEGPRIGILGVDQYRQLLQKTLTEGLSYTPPPAGQYTPERHAAMDLLNGLQQLGPELDAFAGGSAGVQKKLTEVNRGFSNDDPYQNLISNNPVETVVESIAKVPEDQRDRLYIQLSSREANNGDLARARQIVNEHVTNLNERRNALANLDQQEIFGAMEKGKMDDALRVVSGFRTARERARLISRLANQIGAGQERDHVMNFLERAKSLLSSSPPAQDQDQMNALLEIARAYGSYDAERSFEILDPLIDQVNELCTAARTLNGFGQESYDDEELNLQNGNNVSQAAMRVANVLGTLSLVNFDRAKAASDRLRLPEVRLKAYLEIAEQTVQSR